MKFTDPNVTANGEPRAWVSFDTFKTLWFNTGSLCNIECANCYIASSPTADHFVYLKSSDVIPYLDEISLFSDNPIEIGLTGGEPFMNPDIIAICKLVLERGHRLLILTNAMKPMMRPKIQQGLTQLNQDHFGKIKLRVSLDHHSPDIHDLERGKGSFKSAVKGLNWLQDNKFNTHIAGRIDFSENETEARAGFAKLIQNQRWDIDPQNPATLMLFPEMDEQIDIPEITTACWDILGISPDNMMCASSRMVVKRKGENTPSVLPCTLLWDDQTFDMGETLSDATSSVSLNHHHCAKFCVLGGASCSA